MSRRKNKSPAARTRAFQLKHQLHEFIVRSMSTPNSAVLDKILDPVGRCLTPEVARALVDLRADPVAQARVEELADKNTEGQLSAKERSEYEAYVWAGNFIAVLQAKSRAILARNNGS